MDTTTQPTTEQVLVALAASLLPLAGEEGVAAAAAIPAIEQLLAVFKAGPPDQNYTVEQLATIVSGGSAALAKLQADVGALPQ